MALTTSENSIGERIRKLGYNRYSEYLYSDHWKEFKQRLFSQRKDLIRMKAKYGKFVCEFCLADSKLNVHHRTYKRLGSEYLGDVYVICEPCHVRIHSLDRKTNLFARTKKIRRKTRKDRGVIRNGMWITYLPTATT